MKIRTTAILLATLMAISIAALTTTRRAMSAPTLPPVLIWPPVLVDLVSIVGTETLTSAGTVVHSISNGDTLVLVHAFTDPPGGEVFQRVGAADSIRMHTRVTQNPDVFGFTGDGPLGIIFEAGSDVVLKKKPGAADGDYDFILLGYLAR